MEAVRQEAISAGIQGDVDNNFMASYQVQKEQVDAAQHAMTMQIASAQKDIFLLQSQGVVVLAKGSANGLPRSRKATGPFLLTERGDYAPQLQR